MRRTADTFFVRSALGRRILLLFVVCALAPVILVTVLAFRNVTANLREQAQSQLHLSSKTVAMSILERLLILDADLRLITQQIGVAPTAMGDRDLIAGSLEEHFSAILLELENGGEQLLLGELELPGELDPLQVEHLRGGSALLVTVPATEPMGVVFMVRALDPSDPLDGLLWGRINGEYLWGIGSKSTQPPRTELCVLEGLRKPLIRSEAIPPDFSDIYVRAQAEPSNAAQRRFEWESNGARYLAGFWQIPMSTNYGCDAWTVIISEARADVFEPIASFKRDFPLVILLSLWVVLILSINQIRRSLVPLEQLRKGTRRLAKGEFSHPVVIDSEDEFAELAEAFNSMAQDLGRQFTALSTLQAIGRAALDGSQAERIVCSTLTRVPLLLPCNHASVTVFDFGSTGHARTYFSPPPDASCDHARSELVSRRHPVRLLPGLHRLSRGLVHYEADLRTSSWVLRHPDHRDLVTCSRLSVPLRVEQQLIGTLTLSAVAAQAFSEDHIDLATEVADQLAVALHQTLLREELEQEKLRLARLLEHLPSGVIVLDAQRRIVMVNRLARDLIPALTQADVGDELKALGPATVDELLSEPAASVRHELTIEEPATRVFEVGAGRLQIRPDADAYVIVLREVTHERRIEQQMQRQERLAAVGQLAAGIAHDFNNVLQGIVMAGDILTMTEDVPPIMRKMAEDISSEAHRGAKLIRQILDFSRSSVTTRSNIDLLQLIRETADLLRRTIPEDIAIELDLPPDELYVFADTTQLQQIITNLAVNARDAMPDGGELRIEARPFSSSGFETVPTPELAHGDWIVLHFSDTGCGIAKRDQPHIFEPFYTTKGEGKGTGLGLAQVYGLVSQHGGHIDFFSEEGSGTVFTIYLPAARPLPPAQQVSDEPGMCRGNNELVLIVEDSSALLDSTVQGLRQLGYRALAAHRGIEALRLLEGQRDEIVAAICDVVLPEMSGIETIRHMRTIKPDIKVVLMSGYLPEESRNDLSSLDISEYLQKPFSLQKLAQALHTALT